MQPNKHPIKLNLIDLMLVLIMAYTIAPVVSRFISSYLTTYFYMLVVVMTIVLIFFMKGNKSANDCFVLLFPFFCWKAMTFFLPKGDLILWAYGSMLDILPIAIGYYLVQQSRKKDCMFSKLVIALFIITALTTIIGCIRFPGAARYLATVEDSNEAEAVLYNWNNIGGYSFTYMLVLIHPLLIMAYKQGKVKRWVALLGSIAVIVITLYAEYTTAFLLALLSCILYTFSRKLTTKQLVARIFILAMLWFSLSSIFDNALLWLADIVGSENIADRLRSLATGEVTVDGVELKRMELYEMSFRTFIDSPIFGAMTSGGPNGGHSFILDFLAQFGLIGLSILIAMYRTIYKNFFAPYKNEKGYGFVLWVFIQTILLSFINTGAWLPVLSIFVPVLLKVIYKEEQDQ